jgi:uncharacterized protein DUF5658
LRNWPVNLDESALAEGATSMGASYRIASQADGTSPIERREAGKKPVRSGFREGRPMTGTGLAAARIHKRFLMRIAALTIAVVQLLDVATTNAALASGGAELNPVMRLSMAKLGSLWWLPKATVALFILAYVFSRLTPPPTRRIIALTMIVLTVGALVVVNNIAQLAAG